MVTLSQYSVLQFSKVSDNMRSDMALKPGVCVCVYLFICIYYYYYILIYLSLCVFIYIHT